MRGVNYIYQDPNGIDLFDPELVLGDLLKIKSRGFNSIRVGFFPQMSRFYHLTDSLGILCLQDINLPILTAQVLNDSTQFSEIISKIQSFQQLAEKHPSVVGIGLNHFYFDEAVSRARNFIIMNNIVSGGNQWFGYYTRFDPQLGDSDFGEFIMLEMLDRLPADQLEFVLGQVPLNSKILLSGLAMPLRYQSDSILFSTDLGALARLQNLLEKQKTNSTYAGEFFFTYQDYYFETPSLQVNRKKDKNFILNSRGLFKLNRSIKPETDPILKNKWSIDQENAPAPVKDLQTYLFIIVGIINFFIFLFIYRSYVDFRKNITRSIRRPHGFFVELLERRLITQEQSLYLMIVISVNAAVMLGGIIYFFRTSLVLDYIFSILLPFPELKYYVATIIWQPYLLILSLAVLTMITLYFFSIPVQIIVLFSGSRIRWRQAVATSTWAASPFLLLIPFGLLFYNLLTVMNSYWILGAVLLYFHVWYFYRWLNGTRVMALSSYTRVFIFAVILISMSLAGLYFLNYNNMNLNFHFKVIAQLFYLYT